VLTGSSLQANGQLPSFFERRPLFGFQATPVVQDVCTDEDDPNRKLRPIHESYLAMTALLPVGAGHSGVKLL